MDDQTKKMLMIGGVTILAIVVIISLVTVMKHKKKVDTSPVIIQTTAGPIVVPSTTPMTTMPVTTTPTTTMPRVKKNYILSTDGDYLILENGKDISKTSDYTKATPISVNKFNYNNADFYSILTETGKYISINDTTISYVDANDVGALVLVSSNYPTSIYIWGSASVINGSLAKVSGSANDWSVVIA